MSIERAGLGNTIGRWIGDRRTSTNAGLARRFGQMVLDRHPGMGEYMSRTLFGTPNRQADIQWTVEEIKKLVSVNSGLTPIGEDPKTGDSGSSMLTRFPIAPTYDYLLTLDQVVGDIVNEINRIDSMGSIGSNERAAIDKRVIMPDFRPLEFHMQTPLGALDATGNDLTAGQMLGFPRHYTNAAPHTKMKTRNDLVVDNAALLSYLHMNNIIALSQGLWKVNFTDAKVGGDSEKTLQPGDWINATRGVIVPAYTDKNRGSFFLLAQDVRPQVYPNSQFIPTNLDKTVVEGEGDRKGYFGAYTTPKRWSTASGVYTALEGGGAQPSILHDVDGSPEGATVATEDVLSGLADGLKAKRAPYGYFWAFRQIAQSLKIDIALRNLHADLQVAYAQGRRMYTANPTNPSHHAALNSFRTGCPAGSVKVFRDRDGKMVPETINTPSGKIMNPNIVGGGRCVPIIGGPEDRQFKNAPTLASSRTLARAGLWGDDDDEDVAGSYRAGLFGGGGRSSRASGPVKTNQKFEGKAVYRGSKGGLFVKTRKGKKYI